MLPTITAIGNLKYLETKFTQSGKSVTSFTLNCSEKNSKGEYENLNIKGEVWEKASEFVQKYFKDGSVAIVTGKLVTDSYAKQDGSKVYTNKFLFPKIDFAPKDQDTQAPQQNYQQPSSYTQQNGYQSQERPQPKVEVVNHQIPDIDIDESQIPF